MPLSIIPRPAPMWLEPEPIPEDFDWRTLHPHRLVASLLYRQGFRTADDAYEFLTPHPISSLDPYRLPNLGEAIARTSQALRRGARVGIFGDYDADGITSTALLTRALQSATANDRIVPFVPDRTDGYGVTERGVRFLKDAGCELMIAVDTGSNDQEIVAIAQSLGMDVVILDHHSIHSTGPDGAPLVNPQLNADGTYHELTGVGVAYLFVRALAAEGFDIARLDGGDESRMLDLVALGTVADVGSLRNANRVLVREGMRVLCSSTRPGVRALCRHAQIEQKSVSPDRIGFGLGPRLNASGRLQSPRIALDLMLAESDDEADPLAMEIERLNHERRTKTDAVLASVAEQILAMPDWQSRPFLALYGDGWDHGLVGPIASKVAERMGVPAIIMERDGTVLKGSGRSVGGANLLAMLNAAASFMTRYGGHAGAAGVTLDEAQFDQWLDAVSRAASQDAVHLPIAPSIPLQAWLPEAAWTPSIVDALADLEPFGHGNKAPMFGIKRARLVGVRTIGSERQHLKLTLGTRGREMEVVKWNAGHRADEFRRQPFVDVAGHLERNVWQGVERLQVKAEDIRLSQE